MPRLPKAGDRNRTGDIQLGKPDAPDSKHLNNNDLRASDANACTGSCTGCPREGVDAGDLVRSLMALPLEERVRVVVALLGGQPDRKESDDA
jgi:hypothetical protein